MRGIFMLMTIMGALGSSFYCPYVGVLAWVWYAVMYPEDAVYNFQSVPLNLIIAIVALVAIFLSKEKKSFPSGAIPFVVIVLFLWMTLNSFVSVAPEVSWPIWNRVWKTYLLGLVVGSLTNSKARFHAIAWVIAASIAYWGVKGGLFTIASGGGAHALGPSNSELGDNNAFALGIVIILPLLNYLRLNTANRYIRIGLVATIVLCVFTVLGSQSRGAFISLGTLAFAFWLRTRNKLVYPVAAVVIAVPTLKFMPQSFWDRMATISQYQTDGSFQGRVDAWYVAWRVARDHFPFGTGFWTPFLSQVWDQYLPDNVPHAAHSIYFEVLGENGFPALALFLLMIILSFLSYRWVVVQTNRVPELKWANDLARMLQLSLFAFCVGGSALSMAYYDVFVLQVWLSAALKAFTMSELKRLASPARAAPAPLPAAGVAVPAAPRYRPGFARHLNG